MTNRNIRSFLDFLPAWWKHKGSLAVSLVITLFAIFVYFATFIGERPTPAFDFISRLELNSLDTRFRYRPRQHPDKSVSFPLRLERVDHWERIASRGDRPSHPI